MKTPTEAKYEREEMYRIAEADIKAKALYTIEGMILGVEPENKMLNACYKFAHVALGHCENPHNEWLKELEETYSKLKDDNII